MVHATQAEHYAILAQLRRRDPQRARIRMEAHLVGVEDFAQSQTDHTLPDGADRRRREI